MNRQLGLPGFPSPEPVIDSSTVGDPARFAGLAELERRLEALPPAPRDEGRVAGILRRVAGGRREALERALLVADGGIPGDAWERAAAPRLEAALAVMQLDLATLIARGQSLQLFGDNLFLELDLSAANLPPGSRLEAGAATLEVTPKPHNGCRKFGARFGADALALVTMTRLRHRNLRGVYLKVVAGGELAVGERVRVLSRGPNAG